MRIDSKDEDHPLGAPDKTGHSMAMASITSSNPHYHAKVLALHLLNRPSPKLLPEPSSRPNLSTLPVSTNLPAQLITDFRHQY